MAKHTVDTGTLDAEAEAGAVASGYESLDALLKKVVTDCVVAKRHADSEAAKPAITPVDETKITISRA